MVVWPRRLASSSVMRSSSAFAAKSWNWSLGSRGTIRTPSCCAMVLISATRVMASEYTSAARLRFTSEAICCAVWMARGSYSSARNVWNQATVLPISRSASRKNVRQNRLRPRLPGAASSGAGWVSSCVGRLKSLRTSDMPGGQVRRRAPGVCLAGAVGNEHIADAPDRLDIAWRRGVEFDELAQARHLHIQAAVEWLELAPACQLSQFFTRQRLARMPHQRLEHGEFTGGQRQVLVVAAQRARAQIEHERAEHHGFVLGRWRPGRFAGRAPAQHCGDSCEQLARIERLAEVVVCADLQADDAIHVLA